MKKWIVLYAKGARVGSVPKTKKNLKALQKDLTLITHATDTSGNLYFNAYPKKKNRPLIK